MKIPTELFKAFDDTFDSWTDNFRVEIITLDKGVIAFLFADGVDPIDYCGFDSEPDEQDFVDEYGNYPTEDYDEESRSWEESVSDDWDEMVDDLNSFIPEGMDVTISLLGESPYIRGFGVRVK